MVLGIVLRIRMLWAGFGPEMWKGVIELMVFVGCRGQKTLVALLEEAHTSPNSRGLGDRLECFLEAPRVCRIYAVL